MYSTSKNTKRAERRWKLETIKRKALNYHNNKYWISNECTPQEAARVIGKAANTPAACSCPFCCGNARRIKGQHNITLQERRQMLALNEL